MFDKVKQLGELKKMRDQAMQMQKALAEETIDLEENGIKIVMSGDQKIREIEIEGEDQSRLVEVINKAIKKSQEVAARKLQEMSGGLGGLLGQ
jgi:DNA-binding protein YbaB